MPKNGLPHSFSSVITPFNELYTVQKFIQKLFYSYKAQSIRFLLCSVFDTPKRSTVSNEPMIIVLAANDDYTMMLAVTVKSLLLNYKGENELIFYIIDDHITDGHKAKFLKTVGPSVSIHWVQVDTDFLVRHGLLHAFKGLSTTYYRLLIPYFLPAGVKKVIYLDSDLVINTDISRLWEIDLEGKVVLAVQDTRFPLIEMAIGNYQNVQLPGHAKYFNAGVLLIDVEKWRQQDISQKALYCTRKNLEFVLFDDQYSLNIVLYGQWKRINPNWNLFPEFFPALPYIMHYVSVKPTSPKYINSNKHFFFRYLDKTDWTGWRPNKTSLK